MRKSVIHHSGFTLIEVLIAITLMSVLFVMVYAGINSATDVKQADDKNAQRLVELQRAFMWIEQDMNHILNRPSRTISYGVLPAVKSGDGSNRRIELSRNGWNILATPNESDLVRVAYMLETNADDSARDEDTRFDLYRAYWRQVDIFDETPTQERLLLSRVQALKFRFMNKAGTWVSEWPSSTASPDKPAGVPRAIEVILTLGDWGEIKRVFRVTNAHGL